MEGVKNREDVECAESETVRTRIQFNVAGKEKKGKNRRTQEAPGAWANQQQEGSRWGVGEVTVLLAGSTVRYGFVWRVSGGRGRGAKRKRGHSEENEKIIHSMHDRRR